MALPPPPPPPSSSTAVQNENNNNNDNENNNNDNDDLLAKEAATLDGYFSDTPLEPHPRYPPLVTTFDNTIIITNLPKVPHTKVEKLTKFLYKIVSRIGTLVNYNNNDTDNTDTDTTTNTNNNNNNYNGLYMPIMENHDQDSTTTTTTTTLGFCLVEYETVEEAMNAVHVLQDYKFDKNHSLTVTLYARAVELINVQDAITTTTTTTSTTDHDDDGGGGEYKDSSPPIPFVEKPNANAWLEDDNQRDQFFIRYGRETVVYWNDARNDPVVDYNGSRERDAGVAWCEYYAHWSPHGTYLATLVPSKGVILWSGPNYEKVGRFPHGGVEHILFSPRENYLLTNNNQKDDPTAIKIFCIPTGKLLRTFPLYPKNFHQSHHHDHTNDDTHYKVVGGGGAPLPPPPPFSWSFDDSYLARMGDGLISIYTTPSMKLLDQRSLATPGIYEFEWSPTTNVIAYWAPESNDNTNAPAHVDLIEIPSRTQLRQKNLFNVTKCIMVWQNEGDYLAVKVTRHSKTKKTFFNNIELFRLNEPGVPVEMLEIKDAVMALQWEPRGSRFAMIHAENPSSTKVNVSFYDMKKMQETVLNTNLTSKTKKGTLKTERTLISELNKIDTLEGKQCNTLYWSPAGQTIVLASLGDSASGTLEFYDVDTKSMTVKEHYRANQVVWDPSGRTVATLVSQPIGGGHFKFAMDNGFILWSFQGKQLYQQSYETFYQLQWRPRESLLSKEEIAKVKKNLKKYEKEFDAQDKKRQRALYLEETKGKRAERTKYRECLARLREIRQRQKPERIALLNGYDSDDESNYVMKEITVTTALSTKEEVVII